MYFGNNSLTETLVCKLVLHLYILLQNIYYTAESTYVHICTVYSMYVQRVHPYTPENIGVLCYFYFIRCNNNKNIIKYETLEL